MVRRWPICTVNRVPDPGVEWEDESPAGNRRERDQGPFSCACGAVRLGALRVVTHMSLTNRESWTLIHGMVLGALFLLGFAGGLEGLYSLKPQFLSAEGVRDRVRRLKAGVVTMAVAAWGTVLTGTWIVYPWYREDVPASPRSVLLANPQLADWHHFGMEWK